MSDAPRPLSPKRCRMIEQGLAGKVAVVTGGGRGIGAALVQALRESGAIVVVADQDAPVPVDVSDAAQITAAIDGAAAAHGRLDLVFSNAGILMAGPTETFAVADFDRIVAVNLRGSFLTARAAIPHLRAAGGGSIVFTASTSALVGARHEAAYAASKAGIVGLARSLAAELAVDRIRVNVVAPGWVDTPFNDPVWTAASESGETRAGIIAAVPMRRQSGPAEIVPAMLFVASDAASYITGHVLTVDGGLSTLR